MAAPKRSLAGLVERQTGVARGSTQSARGVSQALGKNLGRTSYTVYNIADFENLTRDRALAIAESAKGRPLTKREAGRLRITRDESGDYRERTKPTDAVSGERLNIYREMKAFKVTFS